MKSNFIKIYSTLNTTEAHLVKFLFENNDIDAVLDNENINFFFGIVSAKDAMTEVWVPADKYTEAMRILLETSAIDLSKYEQVSCPGCGEKNCGLFDYCWKCSVNLKTGEPYAPAQLKGKELKPGLKKSNLSLYILILLAALIVSAYIAYFHLHL